MSVSEIITDAAEGLFVETGNRAEISIGEDWVLEIKANSSTNVLGGYWQHIAGIQQEITVGGKHETVVGIMVGTGFSYSWKRWYGNENHVNYAKFRQQCVGNAMIDSDATLSLIGGEGNVSKVVLGHKSASIEHAGAKIAVKDKNTSGPGQITINNGNGCQIIMHDGQLTIRCRAMNFDCEAIHFHSKCALAGGKNAGLFS